MENLVNGAAFWRQRRVFITGHTGFMGGWLVLLLQRLGARVSGYALDPPTTPSLFETARVAAALHSDARGDVRDLERLVAVTAAAEPEIVFHLAAQPLVLESYRMPLETYAVNVMGTAHILEAARRTVGVKTVVVVTSDKCYRNQSGGPFTEDDPLGGADPYSSSKACAELISAAYRSSFFNGSAACHIATVRAGNIIGGGDWAKDRLVPDCVRAFLTNQPVVLRHPQAVRPWQHVLDAVNGYLLLAEKLCTADGAAYASAWNFGPDVAGAVPVERVATGIMDSLGGTVVRGDGGRTLPEAPRLQLDASRAGRALGWRQQLPIDRALAETGAWYRAWAAGDDMAVVTCGQTDKFLVS